MMGNKIGVVTYVRTDNYGAELQGYALQRRLILDGYDAECIDFDKIEVDSQTHREMVRKAILNRFKKVPLHAIPSIVALVLANVRGKFIKPATNEIEKKKKRMAAFEEFWHHAIRHSRHYTMEELYNAQMPYDALIAGSDQIWNYTRTGYLDPYFLTFCKSGGRKLSYAASFSVSEIPDRLKEHYAKLIKGMDVLAVRENEGADIIRQLTGLEAKVVLDPTLLLDKEEWMKVASDRYQIDKPYILTYSLNTSKGYWRIVNVHAKKYGLHIVNLRHDFHADNTNLNRTDIFDAGPREFLYLLANAKMVITNSFHGTIFSINFGVPFVSVLNKISETNSRVISILTNLGLEDRLIYDNQSGLKSQTMDFTAPHERLEALRRDSHDFLLDSLKN